MSKNAFRKTLKFIKKIQDSDIGENEKLEPIKSKLENGEGITLEEKKILLKKLRRLYTQKPEIKSQFKDEKENQTKTKP